MQKYKKKRRRNLDNLNWSKPLFYLPTFSSGRIKTHFCAGARETDRRLHGWRVRARERERERQAELTSKYISP